jgi:hypothetical protein
MRLIFRLSRPRRDLRGHRQWLAESYCKVVAAKSK